MDGAADVASSCGRTVSAFDDDAASAQSCATCGGKLMSRSDDREAVIRDRLKVHWRETQPMIAFYQTHPTYRAVDGAQTPDRVGGALIAPVASAHGKPVADLTTIAARRSESNA